MRAAGAPGSPGKLTTAQQEYVVERLAAFENPDTVVRSVGEKFGIAITRQALWRYDPTRNPGCPARWTVLFHARRQAILESKGAPGALDRAAQRERVTRCAIEALAGSMLEDIVRQMGAGRTPPRGAPPARPLTDAERARAILALLAKAQPADEAVQPAREGGDGPERD
jgi:hypothetical protein